MPTPVRYHMSISTEVPSGTVHLYLALYDENHDLVQEPITRDWSSFCFTWQDLVHWIEARWVEAGGTLNVSLNRPSPFVDLT
jgi:hypothetical protein